MTLNAPQEVDRRIGLDVREMRVLDLDPDDPQLYVIEDGAV